MKHFKFPAGEVHVNIEGGIPSEHFYIPRDLGEDLNAYLMRLVLSYDAVERTYGFCNDLILPYLPYSRQDRVANPGECFSLMVVAHLLSYVKTRKIVTLDVHSDVAFAAIPNLVSITTEQTPWERFYSAQNSYDVLVLPDAGAAKKYKNLSDKFKETLIMIKTRDTVTGKLNFNGASGPSPFRKRCLIVDDICDGGATFTSVAQSLLINGAKSVDLQVTHGIFSKGVQVLRDAGIEKIYTTDSFPHENLKDVEILPVEHILSYVTNGY